VSAATITGVQHVSDTAVGAEYDLVQHFITMHVSHVTEPMGSRPEAS